MNLQDYLTEMETELNNFKLIMSDKHKELSRSDFFCWYFLDEGVLKKYTLTATTGIGSNNQEDNETAKYKTYTKLEELLKHYNALRNSTPLS